MTREPRHREVKEQDQGLISIQGETMQGRMALAAGSPSLCYKHVSVCVYLCVCACGCLCVCACVCDKAHSVVSDTQWVTVQGTLNVHGPFSLPLFDLALSTFYNSGAHSLSPHLSVSKCMCA